MKTTRSPERITIEEPTTNEHGTIARAGAIFWFLWHLEPGETFTVAELAKASRMTWDATKYQLTMLSLSIPLRQLPDASWQIISDE